MKLEDLLCIWNIHMALTKMRVKETGEMEPQRKEYWQPLETGRNKELILPWRIQEGPDLLASWL